MLRITILSTAGFLLFCFESSQGADSVDYTKQVQPIFMQHCSGCHGEKKGLGGLRLHTAEAIQKKWDKDDHLIVKGKPEESELYGRLVLPADHKKFMPKKGKPLAAEKLSLIHEWIKQGAVFTVAATAKPEAVKPESNEPEAKPQAKPVIKDLPLPEVAAADPAAIKKLTDAGAQVTALFAGSPLLQVSYALRGEPAADADLAALEAVADQVYSLNLAKSQISDQGLTVVAKLKNLSKLHLENSSVTDSGLTHLSGLTRLQYLNLYGTTLTDAGLNHLKGLQHLQKLYVWRTKVSYDAAKAMEKAQPGLAIDLGFDHPVIMRKRLTKELKQAKETSKQTEAEFQKAKTAFDRAKKDQETAKKRSDELQKKLDALDGKKEEKKDEKSDKKAEGGDNKV